MESAQQFGRMSVCNAPKMSFMEMTNHFEELGMGKETKMSDVMGMQDKPEHQNTGIQSVLSSLKCNIGLYFVYSFCLNLTGIIPSLSQSVRLSTVLNNRK